jgi:two-component system response regulator HydG
MQAKLLRALQQREIKRIAGAGTIPVNIRLVAATSRDLCTTEFRRELYYRLNVVSVRTSALRDRPEDIPLLARHFIRKFGDEIGRPVRGLSPEAEAALVRYPWPGNVRQLENAIERAVVLGSTDLVVPEDLPPELFEGDAAISTYDDAITACKRAIVGRALAISGGDYKETAAILGLCPTSVHRFIRNLGLKR